MESKWIFGSFSEWLKYLWSAAKKFGKGFARIVFALVFGVCSIFVHVWRAMVRFVGKYPAISLASFFCIVIIVYVLTFVKMRHRAVSAEDQRNLISWQFKEFKKQHGYE